MKSKMCLLFMLLGINCIDATYKVYYFPPSKVYKKKWMTGNSLPRMRMNSALFPSSAITDAGTVAMATGMPVASVMSMANSPVQRSILSTMANSVRNDMSPLRNNIANPRQSTASLMPNNLSMNPMMSSTTASKDPFISTMSSIMSMLTNSMMAQSNNPMIPSASRRLMTSMTQPIATKMTGNNNAMMGGAMTPAANSETTAALRFPSADEVLSSAMMEAVGQTRLASYPMSRFFGSSYF
eukprot:XP_011437855.1 PREDICTED: uncharacterized protein LOC105335596 [Crassostrea gigas]